MAESTGEKIEAVKGIGDLLFGTSGSESTALDQLILGSGITKEYTDISPEAVERILQQVLGGTEGLASIFSQEQVSGLYSSTTAAQASGDLLAQLAGEIAKLTAPKITERTEEEKLTSEGSTETTKDGLLSKESAKQVGTDIKGVLGIGGSGDRQISHINGIPIEDL